MTSIPYSYPPDSESNQASGATPSRATTTGSSSSSAIRPSRQARAPAPSEPALTVRNTYPGDQDLVITKSLQPARPRKEKASPVVISEEKGGYWISHHWEIRKPEDVTCQQDHARLVYKKKELWRAGTSKTTVVSKEIRRAFQNTPKTISPREIQRKSTTSTPSMYAATVSSASKATVTKQTSTVSQKTPKTKTA